MGGGDAIDVVDRGALAARWQALASRLGAPEAEAARTWAGLVAAHGQPHRRYHTLEHVAEVLAAVDGLAAAAGLGPDDRDAVEVAAWFHDAVYDPTAAGNEAASARLAVEALAAWPVGPDQAAEVARLVELTAGHLVADGDLRGAVLVDADLAILGADPDRYDRYAADVRAEYVHVPDDAWRVGRGAVLRTFLDVDPLYATAAFRATRQAAARANLTRELDALEPDGHPSPT